MFNDFQRESPVDGTTPTWLCMWWLLLFCWKAFVGDGAHTCFTL